MEVMARGPPLPKLLHKQGDTMSYQKPKFAEDGLIYYIAYRMPTHLNLRASLHQQGVQKLPTRLICVHSKQTCCCEHALAANPSLPPQSVHHRCIFHCSFLI